MDALHLSQHNMESIHIIKTTTSSATMLTGLSQREINPNNAAATIVQEMTAEDSNAADEDGNHEEEDDAHFEKISTLTLQI
jgi:hypothetical protein